jgi:UDP-4-amino-4,6-dideoxy-N-acetyl-beta-L-altrosamine transaminase
MEEGIKTIPYSRQWIDEVDIESVSTILLDDYITQGPTIDLFEKAVCDYVGAKYAVAFSSGTAALHGAMVAAGIKTGDEIVTSPITFVASSNAAVYVGGIPRFSDIDPTTYCINCDTITEKISRKTKAIIPVDYAGFPVDVRSIKCQIDDDVVLIEDAAHAFGGSRNGKRIGLEADMTMFSFHPVKSITTGEGGMIVTNNEEYAETLRIFRTHGITRDREVLTRDDGPWYYEMQSLGFNYRLTDIHAALGLSQLQKLDLFIDKRNKIASIYNNAFKEVRDLIVPPIVPDSSVHAYHLYPLLLDPKISRHEFFLNLKEKGIHSQVHYIPVHLQPFYQNHYGYQEGDFPFAEDFYRREISIPIFPKMESDECEYVISSIYDILQNQ